VGQTVILKLALTASISILWSQSALSYVLQKTGKGDFPTSPTSVQNPIKQQVKVFDPNKCPKYPYLAVNLQKDQWCGEYCIYALNWGAKKAGLPAPSLSVNKSGLVPGAQAEPHFYKIRNHAIKSNMCDPFKDAKWQDSSKAPSKSDYTSKLK
jgi:hypothetical protein